MRIRTTNNPGLGRPGVAATELAIWLPFLVLMFAVAVDFCRIYFTTQTVQNGRGPWVVLPQPEPGSRVTAGPLTLETRARGEAPITEIRLVLDGVSLSVALDRRDDTTWRGRATTRVTPGPHTVAVAVIDGQGRTGTYRWQFNAAGS